MLKVLRDMNIAGVTVHGFRSCFTDWAAERTETPKEIVDKALAHRIPNAVEAAYRRTDFFDKRRALMSRWADFVMHDVKTDTRPPSVEPRQFTCDRSKVRAAA